MLALIMTIEDRDTREFLENLFNDHSGRMYRAAYKILENRQDAEDALQDTFVKICANTARFMSVTGDELILLLIICTRNTARDILRRRNTAQKHAVPEMLSEDGEPLIYDIPDPDADTLEIVVKSETVRETAALIDSLPEAQKDVIVLKYRYNMREKEIAQILGISETAVSSRILRAKERLRRMLSEAGQC